MNGQREGFVLLAVILSMFAITLATSGLLFVAAQEVPATRGMEELLRARLAAESAVRVAVSTWSTAEFRNLEIGTSRTRTTPGFGGDGVIAVTVERLARPLFLLRVTASLSHGVTSTAAVLLRGLDPGELLATFPEPIGAIGPVIMGPTDSDAGPDGGGSGSCGSGDAGASGSVVRDVAGLPMPSDTVNPVLGPLSWRDIAALADGVRQGDLSPRPSSSGGSCDVALPDNWGAPLEPHSPCGDHFPLVFAPGDLRLDGGSGQGVLVVQGDLTLTRGNLFRGAVLVGGSLVVEDGASIVGAVTVLGGGGVAVAGDSTLRYDPCAVHTALERAVGLDRPLRPRHRFWLPHSGADL